MRRPAANENEQQGDKWTGIIFVHGQDVLEKIEGPRKEAQCLIFLKRCGQGTRKDRHRLSCTLGKSNLTMSSS
jgi:hypothetical protein